MRRLRSQTRLENISGGGVGEKESDGGVKGEAFGLGGEGSGARGEALERVIKEKADVVVEQAIEQKEDVFVEQAIEQKEDVVVEQAIEEEDVVVERVIEEKEDVVVEQAAKEECELDLGVSASGKEGVDLAENGNGGGCEGEDVVRKANSEEEGLNAKVLSSGRVLRSRMKRGDDGVTVSGRSRVLRRSGRLTVKKDCEEADEFVDNGSENERVELMKVQNGKRNCEEADESVDNGSENERVEQVKVQNGKRKCEEADEFADNGSEIEKVDPMKVQSGKRKLKRKRGRPPKIKSEKQDELVEKLPPKTELKEQDELVEQSPPRKRGRPRKIKSEEQDELVEKLPPEIELEKQDKSVEQLPPRKRGRPPKAVKGNCLQTVAPSKKGNVGRRKGKRGRKGKKGLTTSNGANLNAADDMISRRSSEDELENKISSPVKKIKSGKFLKSEDNGVASQASSNNVETLVPEERRKKKEKVREQIKERLSAAGWTVDLRQRNGRDYQDAVYVSLDKKTHWSITLAYTRLKNHYEAGDGEGKVYGPGFKFTPIPEEDFNILTKVMIKACRSDKGMKKGARSGKKVGGVGRKLIKGKPGSHAVMGKSVKGKMKMKRKRKRSPVEEDSTYVTSAKKMPVLVRDHKRHKTQNKKRGGLIVRNAEVDVDSEVDGYVPYSGKRTVLAWMIDLGTVVQNGKVHYMKQKRQCAPLDGNITGDGIHCGCCDETVTISDFEAHAGSKLSDPLKNIHIEGGTSLLQCLLDSWNKQDESERIGFHFVDVAGEDPNDDSCGVCGDGGDLICCDGCPSTFHQSCLDINTFPSGDWHCVYCCCKFCGSVGGSSNQRDCDENFSVSTLLTCHLCEEKYHRSCVEADDAKTEDSGDAFFCGNRCQELSKRLEMLLGAKHEIEDGFSVTFIRRSDVGSNASQTKPQKVESNSKLAVALSVMNECFMPYIDQRSGTNLIHSILYNCGSNFKRLNYSGFVTAILEKGDEIISAASIRIHGNRLAEMPFIGTRYMYRRQGMCRRLLSGIEYVLSSLNVELLVIPAISELRETWTSVFGFEPLELTNKKIIKNMSLLVFPHVDMLQKMVPKDKEAGENMVTTEVSNLEENHTVDKVASNGERANLSGSDLIIPDGSFNNAPDITSNTIDQDKSPEDVMCKEVVCHENLPVEDKSTANPPDNVNDTCARAEDINMNTSHDDCIMPNRDEKSIDSNGQFNNGCVIHAERQCLEGACVSGEAVLTSNASMHLKLQSITEDFPVNHEKNSGVVSALDADEAEECSAETPNLTNLNAENCQSTPVDGVNEDGKASGEGHSMKDSVDDSNILPADTDLNPNTKGSSDVAEPDLPVGQTALSNGEGNSVKDSVADIDIALNMKGSSDLAEPDLPVDQTAWNNGEGNSMKDSVADTDISLNMKGSSDLAEPDSPVDQTARSNGEGSMKDSVADTDVAPNMKGSSDLAEPNLPVDQTALSNGEGTFMKDSVADTDIALNMKGSSDLAEPDLPVDQTAQSNGEGHSMKDSAGDSIILPFDINVVPDNEHLVKGSSDLAEPELLVDQTVRSNCEGHSIKDSVTDSSILPADTDIVPNSEHSTKLAETDFPVDETAESSAPSSCTPSTATGVSLHCASAGAGTGTASCGGSTEVIVLSNQAS